MNTYSWSAAFALLCLTILLAQLVWVLVENYRARRNEEHLVDHLRLARGMIELNKQGRLPRHSVLGEIWMESRTPEDIQ